MNYKPCGDKILVKAPDIKDLEKTKSGLLVPGPGFVDHIWAEVVEISDGFYSQNGVLCHVTVKVGDVVAFHKGVGLPVILDDEKYLLIRDIDIHMKKKRADSPQWEEVNEEENQEQICAAVRKDLEKYPLEEGKEGHGKDFVNK